MLHTSVVVCSQTTTTTTSTTHQHTYNNDIVHAHNNHTHVCTNIPQHNHIHTPTNPHIVINQHCTHHITINTQYTHRVQIHNEETFTIVMCSHTMIKHCVGCLPCMCISISNTIAHITQYCHQSTIIMCLQLVSNHNTPHIVHGWQTHCVLTLSTMFIATSIMLHMHGIAHTNIQ